MQAPSTIACLYAIKPQWQSQHRPTVIALRSGCESYLHLQWCTQVDLVKKDPNAFKCLIKLQCEGCAA